MKRRTRVAISVLTGVAAVLVTLLYTSSVRSEAQRASQEALERYGGDVVSVVVSTRDIEAGDTLDETNVAVEEWVASLLPPHAFTSYEECAGKVATSSIPQHAVICPDYTEVREGTMEVPAGTVAVAVACDAEHAVGGALSEGDMVEVYASANKVADRLTRARVLDTNVCANGGGELSWVTVAVAPDAVKELLACASQGALTLVVPAGAKASAPEKDGA